VTAPASWRTDVAGPYDVAVIGGGIHGVSATYEAARRGLSVVLLERGDFGGGTSSNSMKIVHGGLRYLQDLDVRRVVSSHREFRILRKIAPELVQPLSCRLDVEGRGAAFALKFRAGLALYHQVAQWAARAVPNAPVVPASRFPGWYDGIVVDTEELLLAYLHTAFREGGGRVAVRNHTGDVTVARRDGRAIGVHTEQTGLVEARAVIECVGVAREGQPAGVAMNLVVDRLDLNADGHARGFVHPRDGRNVFTAPWRDASMVGTFERPFDGDSRRPLDVPPAWIDEFLAWLAPAHPELAKLGRSDVRFVHAGLLPKDAPESAELSRASKLDEAEDGRIRVLGVKYTTSRALASRAVQRAAWRGGKAADDALDRLVPLVSRRELVREFVAADASRARRLAASELTTGEVEFAVGHELARDLSDVLFRRTRAANAGHPGDALVAAVASEMAALSGWTEAERARQVERFERDVHFVSTRKVTAPRS